MKKLATNSFLKIRISKNDDFYLMIGWESTTNELQGCYYGIKLENTNCFEKEYLDQLSLYWKKPATKPYEFPFGWDFFWGPSGNEHEDCRWWRWDDWNSIQAMADGNYLNFIKKNVINQHTIDLLRELHNHIVHK